MSETSGIVYKLELSKKVDLELVEQLGSGIPRIIEFYSKDCFQFSDIFLRIMLPKTVSY